MESEVLAFLIACSILYLSFRLDFSVSDQDKGPTPESTPGGNTAAMQANDPTESTDYEAQSTTANGTRTRVVAEESATADTDPKDTMDYLVWRGWELVTTSEDAFESVYRGYYGGETAMKGGLVRTVGGRRRFLVQDPDPGFVRAAEDGDCLLTETDLAENTFEVHFDPEPDTFGDGIEVIEQMLEAEAAHA